MSRLDPFHPGHRTPQRPPVGICLGRLVFCLALMVLPASSAMAGAAAELTVRPLTREVLPDRVAFTFELAMKGIVSVRDELRDGASMLVEGSLELTRERLIRSNEQVAHIPLEWIIRHDPLTREFTVIDAAHTVTRGAYLDTVLREAWRRQRHELVPEEPLEPGETYHLRLKLVLRYAQVPPWLERALFFWSWELSPMLEYEEIFEFAPPQ